MDILPLKEESVFSKVETNILMEKIVKIVDTKLPQREREIVRLRYGIGGKSHTQIDVAEKLGISRSYVSRIEKKALSKISKIIGSVQ